MKEKPTNASDAKKATMRALVYGGPGKIELKEIQKPGIEKPTDAVVKILKMKSPPWHTYVCHKALRLDRRRSAPDLVGLRAI